MISDHAYMHAIYSDTRDQMLSLKLVYLVNYLRCNMNYNYKETQPSDKS